MSSPIADMLTIIRNALAAGRKEAVIPFSIMKTEISRILKEHDYIAGFEVIKDPVHKNTQSIKVTFKYISAKQPAISSLKIISKPARRVYSTKDELPIVLNNIGIAIISTSQGIMTNNEAKKRKLGGEVVCE